MSVLKSAGSHVLMYSVQYAFFEVENTTKELRKTVHSVVSVPTKPPGLFAGVRV